MAEDLTTIDGKTYKNVTVRKVEVDGLAIVHESGAVRVPFTNLSEEIQKRHGYDPERAAAHAKEQAAALEAIPWERRFKFEPAKKDNLSLDYETYAELEKETREVAEKEGVSRDQIMQRIARLPKGGIIYGEIRRSTIGAANTEYFTILVNDSTGKQVAKVTGDNVVAEVPGVDRLWWNVLGLYLSRPLQAGDTVRIVDRLANSHVDFVVKARQ